MHFCQARESLRNNGGAGGNTDEHWPPARQAQRNRLWRSQVRRFANTSGVGTKMDETIPQHS